MATSSTARYRLLGKYLQGVRKAKDQLERENVFRWVHLRDALLLKHSCNLQREKN